MEVTPGSGERTEGKQRENDGGRVTRTARSILLKEDSHKILRPLVGIVTDVAV